MLDEKDLQARFDGVERRLDTLEQHMGEMEDRILKQSAHNMRVILESSVDKKLNLILEALEMQQEQMKQLAAKSRVEELEEEIDFLKAVVRSQSQRIEALEKRLA